MKSTLCLKVSWYIFPTRSNSLRGIVFFFALLFSISLISLSFSCTKSIALRKSSSFRSSCCSAFSNAFWRFG